MKILIYKKDTEELVYGNNKHTLEKIAESNLSDDEFVDLVGYFEDNAHDITVLPNIEAPELDNILIFEVTNIDEIMQESPLPDGIVINASEFEEAEEYTVIIGMF